MNTAVLTYQLTYAQTLGLMPYFEQVAVESGVPIDVLLAVASQETGIGSSWLLTANWTGDNGHGRGIMQIDDRWHKAFIAAHENDNHLANIRYGASILKNEYNRYGNWFDAFDAYNSGRLNDDKGIAYAQATSQRVQLIQQIRSVATVQNTSILAGAIALGIAWAYLNK